MSTADKLLYLQGTKSAIKDAIVAKGVDVPIGTTFREYANKIGDISGGGTPPPITEPWVRPTEWLALPDNVDGVQKVSILNAVFDTDSEFIALLFEGACTIDWGDGVTQNFASGVKAEHKYEYSNVSLNSDTVTKFGYKQCVITITPQSGQSLTYINLNTYNSVIGSSGPNTLATGFLDLRINSLSCNILHISRDPVTLIPFVTHTMLEQCLIGEIVCTNASAMFNSCYALQSVSFSDLSTCTNATSMFANCYALHSVPLIDLSACTDTSYMFYNCYSLQSIPLIDLSACTNASYMFSNCQALHSVPLIDLSACTNASSMFSNCQALQSIPLIDLSVCTKTISMFHNCYSLQSIPLIDLSACTDTSYMFYNCRSLKRVLAQVKVSFSIANAKMSATALNEMYSILPTVTGQTVTVTGNYGVSGDDPTVATAKGWTVVG